jgi:hypothetical protein
VLPNKRLHCCPKNSNIFQEKFGEDISSRTADSGKNNFYFLFTIVMKVFISCTKNPKKIIEVIFDEKKISVSNTPHVS